MRLGVVVDLDTVDLDELVGIVGSVAQAGLEMIWLRSSSGRRSVTAAAAACTAVSEGLLVGAEVAIDATHPLYLAEERNVADQLLGGRLVLALRNTAAPGLLEEWVSVLIAAGGTTPFRHEGTHFTIPAGLPEHTINPEEKVLVTPAPFSLDPPLWLTGPDVDVVATGHGLSVLAEAEATASTMWERWSRLSAGSGQFVSRRPRPGVRRWDNAGEFAAEFAARLVDERDAWGLDTALVDIDAPVATPEWHTALRDLGGTVRPRVQTHSLPPGLEEFWDGRSKQGTIEREVLR